MLIESILNQVNWAASFHNLIIKPNDSRPMMDDRVVSSVEILKTTTKIGEKVLANIRIKVSFNTESITQSRKVILKE